MDHNDIAKGDLISVQFVENEFPVTLTVAGVKEFLGEDTFEVIDIKGNTWTIKPDDRVTMVAKGFRLLETPRTTARLRLFSHANDMTWTDSAEAYFLTTAGTLLGEGWEIDYVSLTAEQRDDGVQWRAVVDAVRVVE